MRNTKADRRSQRTRTLLSNALIELMHEKPYDAITVQDIIDRANIGRSTFYAHYLDKEDLLVSDIIRVLDALRDQIEEHATTNAQRLSIAPFFHHVQEQLPLYRALVRGGGIEMLTRKAQVRLRQNIEQHLHMFVADPTAVAAPLALVATLIAGTMLTMLTWWIDDGLRHTPEQMDAMFRQLILPGVFATLSGTQAP